MTNTGELLNKIMRAGNFHEKEYLVEIDRNVTRTFTERMQEGVYLKELDVTTRPCRVNKTGERQFSIVLTQGLNRQIRRMCQALGCKVVSLKRIRIMNVELGDLPSGEYRELSDREIDTLYQMTRKSRS